MIIEDNNRNDSERNDNERSEAAFHIAASEVDVEIKWSRDTRPGFCPHCGKCIPFSSVVLKKEDAEGTQVYSGLKAVMEKKEDVIEKKFGISKETSQGCQERIGECPYCHQPVPVREIIFKR